MNPVRVLVVDDQALFRRVMSAVVDETEGFVLVGSAASGEESIVTAGRLRPDLILMDVNLPVSTGWRPPAGCAPIRWRAPSCFSRHTTRTTGMDRPRSAGPWPISPSPRSGPIR